MVCKGEEGRGGRGGRKRPASTHAPFLFSIPTSQRAGDDHGADDLDLHRDLLRNIELVRDEAEHLRNLRDATRYDPGLFKEEGIAPQYRNSSDIEGEIEALETKRRDLEEMLSGVDLRSSPARDAEKTPSATLGLEDVTSKHQGSSIIGAEASTGISEEQKEKYKAKKRHEHPAMEMKAEAAKM